MAEKIHEFPRTHRLGGRGVFAAIYAAGHRQSRGPLVIYSKPNALPHNRWGLSVPRRFGPAVRRNRVKRLLRECIRLLKCELVCAYDIVIVVRPHNPMRVEQYQQILKAVMVHANQHWKQTPPTIT